MELNLPTDVLRNFVAVVEHGSMMRASNDGRLTQAALSLQMKKLAGLVGTPIFSRHRNGVMLTPAGEALLVYARGILELNDQAFAAIAHSTSAGPLRVGIVQDFAALLVAGPISHFRRLYPDTVLRIKSGNTPELHTQFDAALLDIMIGVGPPEDCHSIGSMPLCWLGDPALARQHEVPLAVMDSPCPFREHMIAALDRVGRPYRIVLETPGIAALGAAVNAGLALTCRNSSLPFLDNHGATEMDVPLGSLGLIMKHQSSAIATVRKMERMIRGALNEFTAKTPTKGLAGVGRAMT